MLPTFIPWARFFQIENICSTTSNQNWIICQRLTRFLFKLGAAFSSYSIPIQRWSSCSPNISKYISRGLVHPSVNSLRETRTPFHSPVQLTQDSQLSCRELTLNFTQEKSFRKFQVNSFSPWWLALKPIDGESTSRLILLTAAVHSYFSS